MLFAVGLPTAERAATAGCLELVFVRVYSWLQHSLTVPRQIYEMLCLQFGARHPAWEGRQQTGGSQV